jgi:hypothetical protein
MNELISLKEIAKFFDTNYHHFLRFEDGTIEYNGTTYVMYFAEDAPVPVLRLGYYDDEGELNVLVCIIDFGILLNLDDSGEEKLSIVEYRDIVKEEKFGLTFYDCCRLNYILTRAVKDLGF